MSYRNLCAPFSRISQALRVYPPQRHCFGISLLADAVCFHIVRESPRSKIPKDKFFVMDETTKDTIWWTSPEYKNDNKPVTKAAWKELKKLAGQELSGKKLYVVDTFCGANENTRLKIRFIMEVAWQAHFVKNMFIRPTDEELEQLRRTRLRGAERFEGEGGELQGTGSELGDGGRLQPDRKDAGNPQHVVRRRDEEGYVLLHELPAAAEGHGFDALLGQHRREGREHGRSSSVCRARARRPSRPTRSVC